MESLPHLELMPRVGRDIARCLYFVSLQPRGKPRDRELDIGRAIAKAHRENDAAPRPRPPKLIARRGGYPAETVLCATLFSRSRTSSILHHQPTASPSLR
jgi:hypothetical protein